MIDQNQPQNVSFFEAISTGWIVWLWIGLILTISGFFIAPLLWIGFILIASGVAYHTYRQQLYKNISWKYDGIYFIALIIAVGIASLTTPTVFSGRDQGSYSIAALHLVQSHQLAFSTPAITTFFDIYGPGKALNFPGFDYTTNGNLITQFPLGYISWLATCISLFGFSGIVIANTFLLFLTIITLYSLLRLFISRWYASWGTAIASVSLPVVWLSKITLSENLALALFVLLSFHLALLFKKANPFYYFSSLSIACFFVFTRIEGFIFLPITLVFLGFSPVARRMWIEKRFLSIILPAVFFLVILIADFLANMPFFKAIAKALLRQGNEASAPVSFIGSSAQSFVSLAHTFWIYNLIPLFIFGIISILLFFKRRHSLMLIPFLLAFPTFFYIIQPNISNDHPWMLRRFLFSIWPTLFISAIIGITLIQEFLMRKYPYHPLFKKRYYATILFLMLLLVQVPTAIQFATFSENKTLLEQTHSLSQKFSDNDLILIDRLASGDGWSMIPEAMQIFDHKNAVYFFNPEDIQKIDMSQYSNVYLIVSNQEASRYTESQYAQYTPIDTYTLSTESLEASQKNTLPEKITRETQGTIFKILEK